MDGSCLANSPTYLAWSVSLAMFSNLGSNKGLLARQLQWYTGTLNNEMN